MAALVHAFLHSEFHPVSGKHMGLIQSVGFRIGSFPFMGLYQKPSLAHSDSLLVLLLVFLLTAK